MVGIRGVSAGQRGVSVSEKAAELKHGRPKKADKENVIWP